jgi:peroxiredoxin Q/BCP
MKLHFLPALILSLFHISPALAENPGDFTVKSVLDDSEFRLSDHRGKVVVLHFLLKTECPVCLRHTHDYAALAATTPEVIHVFLKPDDEDESQEWAGKLKGDDLAKSLRLYRDPKARLAEEYGIPDGYDFHGEVVHYPALVALDGTGAELFRYVGKNNSDRMSPADFTAKLKATKKP